MRSTSRPRHTRAAGAEGDHELSTIRRILTLAALALAVAFGAFALGSGTASADSGVNWDAVAQCESGGNWRINSGNGYSGGLQFSPATWTSNGGTGLAHQASREEQIRVAEKVYATQGIGAWPTCGTASGAPGLISGSGGGGLITSVSNTAGGRSGSATADKCQGMGRGPLGLVDWGQVCQTVTNPGKAFAAAVGIR